MSSSSSKGASDSDESCGGTGISMGSLLAGCDLGSGTADGGTPWRKGLLLLIDQTVCFGMLPNDCLFDVLGLSSFSLGSESLSFSASSFGTWVRSLLDPRCPPLPSSISSL